MTVPDINRLDTYYKLVAGKFYIDGNTLTNKHYRDCTYEIAQLLLEAKHGGFILGYEAGRKQAIKAGK